jgi:hypothetical protein
MLITGYRIFGILSNPMERNDRHAGTRPSTYSVWAATEGTDFGISYTETPAEQALSLRMERYWIHFAKKGDALCRAKAIPFPPH